MLWENLRSNEFNEAVERSNRVCLLPIGCVEAHGIHLPLGCDVMHVKEHCERVGEMEDVVVFPSIYFGEKSGAGEFLGTIIFPEHLIEEILKQCCREIARNGFKKILIVNGHGGNRNMLNNFARSILQERNDFIVMVTYTSLPFPEKIMSRVQDFPYLTKEDIAILEDYIAQGKKGGHGCFTETGVLYNICPDLVRLDLMDAVCGDSTHMFDDFDKHSIYTPFSWMGNYADSLQGSYHAGMNERIARAMGEYVTNSLADTVRFVKNEKVSEEYHRRWLEKNPNL